MSYRLHIKRSASHTGWLEFSVGGAIMASAECWWKNENRIRPGEYEGCATRMDSKDDGFDGRKREAILLHRRGVGRADLKLPRYRFPDPADRWAAEIFIHKDHGMREQASDGCIVAQGDIVTSIWKLVAPKDQYVIDVTIEDLTEGWKRSSERGQRQD